MRDRDEQTAGPPRPADRTTFLQRLALSMSLPIVLTTWIGVESLDFDPWGLGSASSKYSQTVLNQVFGSAYPATGQPTITVVQFDDETARQLGASWPPSYEHHTQVLEQILGHEPAALYIGVHFGKGREDPTWDHLLETLEMHRQRGYTRIYAATDPGDPNGAALRTGLTDVATPVVAQARSDLQEGTARAADLLIHGDPEQLSVAARLYDDIGWRIARGDTLATATEGRPLTRDARERRDRYGDRMSVIWGTRPAPSNAQFGGCRDAQGLPERQLRLVFASQEDARTQCPYTQTLAGFQVAQHPDAEGIEELIRGKIVLYDLFLRGGGGAVIHTPGHVALSRIYLEAMALDNLMVWGDRYIRTTESRAFAWVTGLVVFGTALALALLSHRHALAARWGGYVRLTEEQRDRRFDSALVRLAAYAPLAAYQAALCLLAFFGLRMAPVNWLGLLLFNTLVFSRTFEVVTLGWRKLCWSLPMRAPDSAMAKLAFEAPVADSRRGAAEAESDPESGSRMVPQEGH